MAVRLDLSDVRGEYSISTDTQRLDVAAIHAFLSRSYWSPGIPIGVVERAIANSPCFGLIHGPEQIGFARVITDKATFDGRNVIVAQAVVWPSARRTIPKKKARA